MRRGMFALIVLLLACVLLTGAVSADHQVSPQDHSSQNEAGANDPASDLSEKPSEKKTESQKPVKTPVPVLGGLLGILAAGVLLRRRE